MNEITFVVSPTLDISIRKIFQQLLGCFLAMFLFVAPAAASDDYLDMDLEELVEVDVFAASILSAHIHKAGEWMVSYNVMYMDMDGSRDGNSRVGDATVLADPRFTITPTSMGMYMHMVHAMYAPTNDLTLMVMVPWIEKWMDHVTLSGLKFRTKSEGLGDIEVKGNYVLNRVDADSGTHEFVLTTGLSFPSGSIQQKDFVKPAGMVQTLPYPMQLGSGTYDPIVGLTYLGFLDDFYWGLQGVAKIRVGENDHNYRLSNQYHANSWFNYAWSDMFSTSIRLKGDFIGNIDGSDRRIAGPVPTADPNLRGHTNVTLFLGADFYASEGTYEGLRFNVEVGKPVYQYVDGPQLETDWITQIGLQYKW